MAHTEKKALKQNLLSLDGKRLNTSMEKILLDFYCWYFLSHSFIAKWFLCALEHFLVPALNHNIYFMMNWIFNTLIFFYIAIRLSLLLVSSTIILPHNFFLRFMRSKMINNWSINIFCLWTFATKYWQNKISRYDKSENWKFPEKASNQFACYKFYTQWMSRIIKSKCLNFNELYLLFK